MIDERGDCGGARQLASCENLDYLGLSPAAPWAGTPCSSCAPGEASVECADGHSGHHQGRAAELAPSVADRAGRGDDEQQRGERRLRRVVEHERARVDVPVGPGAQGVPDDRGEEHSVGYCTERERRAW